MKNYILIVSGWTLFLFSCTDMNDNIKEYLDRGEVNYITMVDSVEVNSGNGRAMFTWKVANDPRIEYCNFTWNDGTNAIQVKIDRTLLGENNYYSTIIEELEEGTHIFYIYHSGTKGYDSLSEEVVVTIYGEKYNSNLRPLGFTMTTFEEFTQFNWRVPGENAVISRIIYDSSSGDKKTLEIPLTETSTQLTDYLPGGEFIVQTDYLPEENALDIFTATSDIYTFESI